MRDGNFGITHDTKTNPLHASEIVLKSSNDYSKESSGTEFL